MELYNSYKTLPSDCGMGPCIITLSAGTPHVPPPKDARDFPLYEASEGARYLLASGVSPENVLEEKLSLDTLGNVRSYSITVM